MEREKRQAGKQNSEGTEGLNGGEYGRRDREEIGLEGDTKL